ncbi:MAG: P1 family peptidase [Pseudomonadales bacterium]
MIELPTAHQRTPSGKLRARGAGIPFDGEPGPWNAITDVAGVAVGYRTLIHGHGPLRPGEGPVRTGVTVILPSGLDRAASAVWAGVSALNGNGEMTGFAWVDEAGRCEGPIALTNTHSVGTVRDALIAWLGRQRSHRHPNDSRFWLPVVAETYDGELNDIDGQHVRPDDVAAALAAASSGPIDEGSVGGGTGMRCYQFKAGTGTASRQVKTAAGSFVVGSLVQANFGRRYMCTLAGVPVGRHLPVTSEPADAHLETGSLIVVLATDAPLLPHQLRRLARRAALGMARSGGVSAHYSGDLFLAFTTANRHALAAAEVRVAIDYLPDQALTPLFEAAIQATDEAIVNSFVGTASMTGRDGVTIPGLPVAEVQDLLRRHGRLNAVDSSHV